MSIAAVLIVPSLLTFEQTVISSLSLALLFAVILRRYKILQSESTADSFQKLMFAFALLASAHIAEDVSAFFGFASTFDLAENLHTSLELAVAAVFIFAALEIIFKKVRRS